MWYFFLDTVITKNDGNQKIFQRPGMEHTFGEGSCWIFYILQSLEVKQQLLFAEIITLLCFLRMLHASSISTLDVYL